MKLAKNSNLNSIIKYALLVILLIAVILLLWNPIRALNLQARAGKIMDAYIEQYAFEYDNFLICQLPLLVTLPEDPILDDAIMLLGRARQIPSFKAQTMLLTGRTFCLTGDFFRAVDAFENYHQVNPNNSLGQMENAFAHFSLAKTNNDLREIDKRFHIDETKQILLSLGYTFDYFLEEGNAAFDREALGVAWYWYALAEIFQPLPEEAANRAELLDAMFPE